MPRSLLQSSSLPSYITTAPPRPPLCSPASNRTATMVKPSASLRPGYFEVEDISPPPQSLGLHELPPNTHNGDEIEVQGDSYVVQKVILRYRLVGSRYRPDYRRLEVRRTGRYLINKLDDVQEKLVNIQKGGTRDPAFLALNPLGKVPFYAEKSSNFSLPESSAIMRYLATTRSVPSHWYPADQPKLAAKIDAVMAWHASTLRIGSMITVFNLVISKNLGLQGNKHLVESYGIPTLKAALTTLDTVWLKDSAYVASTEAPTIADLLLSCEVEQLRMLEESYFEEFDNIVAWLGRVRSFCNPHYDDAHKMLHRVIASLHKQRNSSKL